MATQNHHISVCFCTYKRIGLLKRLLEELDCQNTEGLFTYSIVVADNDCEQSAKNVVSEFAKRSAIPVTYCVEPERNIALVRNRSMKNATGDFIAIIDDDEYPLKNWLCDLYKTCIASGADGVLGPVEPYFEEAPPEWVVRGKFFEKMLAIETGSPIGLLNTRTSNVIFNRKILAGVETPFRAEFGTGGEDIDFFHRMMAKGCVFVWCNEAVVYEAVSPSRCTRSYLLRRALHGGINSLKFRANRMRGIFKSFIAVPAYAFVLPFLFIAGEHYFMKYMIKFCAHSGKLLALFHIQPFKEYK